MAANDHHPNQWVADLLVLIGGSAVAHTILKCIEASIHG